MIFVESEYAQLKKVVLTESEYGFPLEPRAEDLRFLDEEAIQENFKNKGRDYSEAYPQLQKQWIEERRSLQRVLEKYGVEVFVPRKLTQNEKRSAGNHGYANFFVRDPFFTIGNCVIEGSLRLLHRRNEIFPIREIIQKQVYPQNCQYVSVPRPEISSDANSLGNGPFLEGGDILVCGKNIFVGNSGLASNILGIEWLKKYMIPQGYSVEMIRLHPDILHLDCALGLVKENLMIICEDAFIDEIPPILKNWERIYVTLDEAQKLATNGLPISSNVYITDPAFTHIGKQLEAKGITVEYVDFSISRSFGGSFRCSTQALLRQD